MELYSSPRRLTPLKHNCSTCVGNISAKSALAKLLLALTSLSMLILATTPAGAAFPKNPARVVSSQTAQWPGVSGTARGTYLLPLNGHVTLERLYSAANPDWTPGHRGVDLYAGLGAPVIAPANGTVVIARIIVNRPVMAIAHADGIRTTFEPVIAELPEGAPVRAGQVIGTVGQGPGHSEGIIHWGAKTGPHSYINPLELLFGVIRLYPLINQLRRACLRLGPRVGLIERRL